MSKPEKPSTPSVRRGGNQPFQKTTDKAQLVELHAAMGSRIADISKIVSIPERTLKKHFKDELSLGFVKANAKVASTLYKKALSGDVTSMIFWLKTRGGWRETSRVEMSGNDGGPIDVRGNYIITPEKAKDMAEWEMLANPEKPPSEE